MPKTKGSLDKLVGAKRPDAARYSRIFFFIVVLGAVIFLIVRNISVFGNALKVVIGFGAVIIVHEFGHFVIAKLSGIKVEAFSIFMPPTLLGLQRTKKGFQVRILPGLLGEKTSVGSVESGDGSGDSEAGAIGEKTPPPFLSSTEDTGAGTEYRIGLIPFGGYVKMLGQDDIGPVKARNDPRSFANKPVLTRMGVLTAGVVFNAIGAIIVFMIVFLIGIKLPPAVVGDVIPDSPAARAGLKPGDEIIEVAGKSRYLDFSNIGIAAALSGANEAVPLKVRHEDGSVEQYAIVAERLDESRLKVFGILQALSLTIAEVSDVNELNTETALLPGDQIKAINGRDVHSYWELAEIVENSIAPEVTLLAERAAPGGQIGKIESHIRLEVAAANRKIKSESDLSHIYSMAPRLRITTVGGLSEKIRPKSFLDIIKNRFATLFSKEDTKQKPDFDTHPDLRVGDVIVAVDDIDNPTYKEMRDITKKYQGKGLPIKVLRTAPDGTAEILAFNVLPKRVPDSNEVLIGIGVCLDFEHPIVAKTIDVNGLTRLEIPRGAEISAVEGVPVSNFYDIVREIRKYPGQQITIDWRLNDQQAGDVTLNVGTDREAITVKSILTEFIPFERLERSYRANGPIEAIGMGGRKTIMFIAQTYVTLKRWLEGLVSPKDFMGPVGIIAVSYHIVSGQPLVYYVYFLGLISAVIAVVNFLPLPPLDGGLVAILLVEKIKGSTLSERTQGIIAYTGWALIGAFFLYVTFNDFVRLIFGN